MCGIVGCIKLEDRFDKRKIISQVSKMSAAILHRGPDDQDIFEFNEIIVGFNRLAINGLHKRANQPFTYNGCSVFCNGEIYNHKELKNKFGLNDLCTSGSDIEIIPYLYKKFGWSFLNLLNGTFAMLLIDENLKEISLITDRFGKRPLYIFRYDGNIYFASELKAFLINFSCSVDRVNISTGYYYGYFPYPYTPVKDIVKILPSTHWTMNYSKKFRNFKENIWYVLKPKNEKMSQSDRAQYYRELLDDAVALRCDADVEVGSTLSGGLDSISVVDSMTRQLQKKIKVFSGLIPDKISTDNINAKKFANDKNLEMHTVNIDSTAYSNSLVRSCMIFDEIPFESANQNMLLIAEKARGEVKVLCEGTGGDEMFFGYPHQELFNGYRFNTLSRLFNLLPKSIYVHLIKFVHKLGYKNAMPLLDYFFNRGQWFFNARAFTPLSKMQSPFFDFKKVTMELEDVLKKYSSGFSEKLSLNHLSYLDVLGYCMLNFQHSDRAFMSQSIEPRTPLSDYRLWEFALGIGSAEKLRGGLKSLMRDFSPHLPKYILDAKKDGFSSPIFMWFKEDKSLRNDCLMLIQNNFDLACDLLGANLIKQTLSDARSKDSQWMDGIRLHSVLVTIIWYKCYFENKDLLNDPKITLRDLVHYG